MRHFLMFSEHCVDVDFQEYKGQLEKAGFSKVNVVDISAISFTPFFRESRRFVRIAKTELHKKMGFIVQWIYFFFTWLLYSLLNSAEGSWAPMKYVLVVCTK